MIARFKLILRRWGFLCKKDKFKPTKLRISKTLLVDGSEIRHKEPVLKQDLPINNHSLSSEIYVWIESKKKFNRECKFDGISQSCVCGKSIEQFTETKIC